jgi:hypothetical protein
MRKHPLLLGMALGLLFALVACGGGEDDPVTPDPAAGDDPPVTVAGLVADQSAVAGFDLLPVSVVTAIADTLRLYYGHTSHGSQLMTGLDMVEAEDAAYRQPTVHEPGGDLGHQGSLAWEQATRAWLDDHAQETHVVIWSWCGGCSDNTPEGIDTYLAAMNQLEVDYPAITFVYMTGHLDGSGADGTLRANNDRIRAYCQEHEKWLFDFAAIESHDPVGTFHPDESDACGWCSDWCATHDCPACGGCAHSHCYNCYRKGMAFWWLLGRIVGWEH